MYFQVVSRLFEVEGFHRLIDVSKLCRAGPFEASRNAFSDENLNKFCPLIERDNGAGFAGEGGESFSIVTIGMTQDGFGFFEAPCFSAALNALYADPFVNVPDSAPIKLAGCRFLCH